MPAAESVSPAIGHVFAVNITVVNIKAVSVSFVRNVDLRFPAKY